MQGLPLPVSIYRYTYNATLGVFQQSFTGRTAEANLKWGPVLDRNHRFFARSKGAFFIVVQASTGQVGSRYNTKIEITNPSVIHPVIEAKRVAFQQPIGHLSDTPFEWYPGGIGPVWRHDITVSSTAGATRQWAPYSHLAGQWIVPMDLGDLFSFQVLNTDADSMIECMALIFRLHAMDRELVEDANLLRLPGNPAIVGGLTINRISSPNSNRRRWRVVSTTGGKITWTFNTNQFRSTHAHELRIRTYARSGPSTCRVRAMNSSTVLHSQNLTISDPPAAEHVHSFTLGSTTVTTLEVDNIPASVEFDLEARLNVL